MKEVIELIENNPFISTVLVVVFTYVLEISPIKVNPWKWLGKNIGRAINGEVLTELDSVKADIKELKTKTASQEYNREKDHADQSRRRIIRAADEIRLNIKHSSEFFDDTLSDITNYKNYCRLHPEYQNEKAKAAINVVEKTYDRCLSENSFL